MKGNRKCLICFQILSESEKFYHPKCSKKFFLKPFDSPLELKMSELEEIGRLEISQRLSVTGVQKKLSFSFQDQKGRDRLTFVNFRGEFIFKPPDDHYPEMPELEHLTMSMAREAGILTADSAMVCFDKGKLGYLTRRFDRTENGKLQMEDMCQIVQKMTADKYHGSMEGVGKKIIAYCTHNYFDAARFYTLALFSFLTGNNDMHLKNFSLITDANQQVSLSPAYDLLPSKLLLPKDPEEMALTINGKKKNIHKKDFLTLGNSMDLNPKTLDSLTKKWEKNFPILEKWIKLSPLKQQTKKVYLNLIKSKYQQIGLTTPN